jgi:YidC/Oxa1 family membrane protein insertase
VLNWLYEAIARIVLALHSVLSFLGKDSGWSWGLSIVFLTMLMRLLLFPLFVKQIRTQRAMQEVQPEVKKISDKYKKLIAAQPGNKQQLQMEQNQEIMKLYKERNANPLTGCLPLLLQLPVFCALFRVLDSLHPDSHGHFSAHYGISRELAQSAGHAKIFGAPIAAAFNSSSHLLSLLNASGGTVKTVAAIMIVLMGATTFWTQRQLMARTQATNTQFASQQKIMLYVLPFTFGIFGFRFPIGVLLYWLTTNVWSMGQQHFVIAKMHAYGPVQPGASPSAKPAPAPGGAGGSGIFGFLGRRRDTAQPSKDGASSTARRPNRPPPPSRAQQPSGDSPKTPASTPGGAAPPARRPNTNRTRRNRNRRGRR